MEQAAGKRDAVRSCEPTGDTQYYCTVLYCDTATDVGEHFMEVLAVFGDTYCSMGGNDGSDAQASASPLSKAQIRHPTCTQRLTETDDW